ncbi:type II toxin-antitoxin system MqsA family antitoxin [Vibrio furnissii]|uniref:type II toxin-antitoxin system MqsA family antitoxin n=1 Tax=Vibrio furnissii TaxID=29494 RepID=UPI003748FA16
MNIQTCPICEMGQLTLHTERITVEHLGQQGQIESQYAVCDCCGSEQTGTAEARFNKRAMIAFKKQVQGLLTGNELQVLRKRWGLKQADAAKVFGGGPVAFSKYESDDVMQSDAMDKLLRLAAEVPAALDKLMLDAGVERNIQTSWKNVAVVDFSSTARKTRIVASHELELEACYG